MRSFNDKIKKITTHSHFMTQEIKEPLHTPELTFQTAFNLHQAGQLQDAEDLYRSILLSDPHHPDANHNLGVLALQGKQADFGLPFFRAALEANPSVAQYWLSYIDALIQAGQHSLARQMLAEGRQKGLAGEAADALDARLSGPSAGDINELATLFNQRSYSDVEALARCMTERFPQHGFGWKALGAVLMEQGRAAEALAPMQKAAELLPLDAEAHSNLGNTLLVMRRLTESEASCRQALDINPEFAAAHFNLGNTLRNLRRHSEAEASYLRALEINPEFTEAEKSLNIIRKELNRLAEAEAGIRRAREIRLLSGGTGENVHSRFNPLDFYRRHKTIGKIVSFLGGLVFLVSMFIMWDKIDLKNTQPNVYAAKVDGVEISMTTFDSNYKRIRELNRVKFAAAFTPELESRLAIRKVTLDLLVNNELLYNEAVRRGFQISDQEVVQSIASLPVFQKNGVFDMELYKQVLASGNQSPKLFEKAQRKDLMAAKARLAVISSVQVTEQELKNLYHKEHDQLVLSYVSVTPKDVWNDVEVSRAELEEFFEKNRILFMTPEKRAISYIRLAVSRHQMSEPVSPEEIEGYYVRNQRRYQAPGEAAPPLRQVKERVVKDLNREKVIKMLLEKAADARFKNGQQAGLGPVSNALGVPVRKTGLFAASAPPPQFAGEQAAVKQIFALKDGEIGGPFETADAVYLVQVSESQPSVPASFSGVRSLLENRVHTEKAAALARKKAEEALRQLSGGSSLPGLRETAPFRYNPAGSIPGMAASPELMEEVFLSSQNGAVASKIYGSSAGWYAVRLKQRLPSSEAGYESLKEGLLKRITPVKQQKVLESWLAEQRVKSKIEINKQLAAAIEKASNAHSSTPPLRP